MLISGNRSQKVSQISRRTRTDSNGKLRLEHAGRFAYRVSYQAIHLLVIVAYRRRALPEADDSDDSDNYDTPNEKSETPKIKKKIGGFLSRITRSEGSSSGFGASSPQSQGPKGVTSLC